MNKVLLLISTFFLVSVSQAQGFYNFGTIPVNHTSYGTVWFRNTTNQDIRVQSVWTTGMYFNSNDSCFGVLRPFQSCTINIRYSPFMTGYHNGQTRISYYDARNFMYTDYVQLSGQAIR